MSEAERRKAYHNTRVLIDLSKVLASTFDDAVIYVTGAQLEILRNLTQYANRQENYASSYEPGYYLTPDAEDWDTVQGIVADLEETLMGNPNTVWGYKARLQDEKLKISSLPGTNTLILDPPAAGELYVVTSITFFNNTSICTAVSLLIYADTLTHYIDTVYTPGVGVPVNRIGTWYLSEGDSVRCSFYGCTSGDDLYLLVHGYIMQVPE